MYIYIYIYIFIHIKYSVFNLWHNRMHRIKSISM